MLPQETHTVVAADLRGRLTEEAVEHGKVEGICPAEIEPV